MKSGKGKWMVAVLIASVAVSVLVLFTTAALGQEEDDKKDDEGVRIGAGALIGCIVVGWIGNFIHRIKKVIKGETDTAILEYLRNHKIVFILGLGVATIVVLAASVNVATEVPSLMLSALLAGYTADSIVEAKETPK